MIFCTNLLNQEKLTPAIKLFLRRKKSANDVKFPRTTNESLRMYPQICKLVNWFSIVSKLSNIFWQYVYTNESNVSKQGIMLSNSKVTAYEWFRWAFVAKIFCFHLKLALDSWIKYKEVLVCTRSAARCLITPAFKKNQQSIAVN